ncbi:hypothetical protein Hs30E_04300 [Lactococcus hodotermopsidis]|uniref:6-hydroxymethylpterin diphosphokinase MptE-like domain-containing protein n=1 Tax=Pseudolactococcus hodotermopsidis TaxID=2709157 RepID=A0A6A0B8Y9_9LACT|nr:6-hydroxymethylpterin diphosphokinase MptE-like protein [Lactococcus hodotermopsidis]GFH41879.1 hypothetical protein Hs30E_04300 [Lactococcus hodotermopsidis]
MSISDVIRKIRYEYILKNKFLTPLYTFAIKKYCNVQENRINKKAEQRQNGNIVGYEELKNLKNKFEGERCFIIATGPSLTYDDLKKIENEYTFGMNSLVLGYDDNEFRPTFYGIQDRFVFEKVKEKLIEYYANSKNVFLPDTFDDNDFISKNWIKFPYDTYYHMADFHKKNYHAKFSDNALYKVYDGYTITYSLVELAVYMGFKEIIFLGFDFGYAKNKKSHFIEHGVVDSTADELGKRMTVSFEVAKKYAEQNGIKILNATRGGYLELFERIDLDSMILK